MDILTKLNNSLEDFSTSITIVDPESEGKLRFGGSVTDTGFLFNQKDTVDLIDLYYNSKYKDGKIDKDGQRKLFMNIVQFKANVAEKQTDLDVKHYNFIPDNEKDANAVWFLKRQFIVWTRENDYGQILNELNKDYSKYGSCVLKKLEDTVERVPIRQLFVSQDATTLKDAPLDGGYVAIKHMMTDTQIKKMPDWKHPEFDGQTPVYEYYTLVDGEFIGEKEGEDYLVLAYVAPEVGDDQDQVLFYERIEEVPLEEAHWDKQDGRWLGVGEVEKQFENQVAINMTENLRRKHLIWGAKKVWQTQGNAVVKNLVKQVQDGAVLEVGANGAINEVPMASQNLQEFELSKSGWEANSDQKAFAFEVSTGEAMPSGTPFRLGVVLANSAARHFELKRENFALFLYRSFFSQLIPIFQKQTKAHNIAVANGEEGTDFVKKSVINHNINAKIKKEMLKGNVPDITQIEEGVKQEVDSRPFMFVSLPEKAYDNVKFFMQLDIDNQETDTNAEMATLTTLYQTLAAQQDPRADKILDQILILAGKNPNKVFGEKQNVKQAVQQATQPQGGGLQTPDLSGLNQAPQNAIA
jgi:hypothetical protein